jgi:hypothetical protein
MSPNSAPVSVPALSKFMPPVFAVAALYVTALKVKSSFVSRPVALTEPPGTAVLES